MPNNKRIFYACQAVGISEMNIASPNLHVLHGVQSVGINTAFDIEQVFELGQLQIYENIEGIPTVEVTLEKVLDGWPLIYTAATSAKEDDGFNSAEGHDLPNRADNQCCLHLAIYDETKASTALGVNNVGMEVYMSGMYVNNVSYTFPVDGNVTESITLGGNHKSWDSGNFPVIIDDNISQLKHDDTLDIGEDEPSGLHNNSIVVGVARRENIDLSNSIIPVSIVKATTPDISPTDTDASGLGNGWDSNTNTPKVHIQSLTISSDFGREDIFELGRKSFYHRPANFPIEVTSELEVISNSGDYVTALEEGDSDLWENPRTSGNNTSDEILQISLNNGYTFDLGAKNKLTSVNFAGGDAGGGNATMTFSYVNYNDLKVIDYASGLLTTAPTY